MFYISATTLVTAGAPFLEQLNTILGHCAEGGLVGRYWPGLEILALLQSKDSALDYSIGVYFVFTISQLNAAFGILVLGHAFSFVLFFVELFPKLLYRQVIGCLHIRTFRIQS